MEFELWWLLPFPVFFGLGWIAARIDIKHLLTRVAQRPAVVLPRPQLPAERAARQGDRVVHRGGQGRPADGRPAFRARQPVPPAGRDRARDPDAPEPPRPLRPRRGATRAGAVSSSRRTTSRRGCSTAPRRCSRGFATDRSGWRRCSGSSRSTSRRRSGRRRSRSRARSSKRPGSRGRRRSRSTTASWRRSRRRTPARTRAREHLEDALQANRRCVRASILLGDLAAAAGRQRRGDRALEAGGDAEPGVPGARRAPVVEELPGGRRYRAPGSRCCAGISQQYPSLDLLDVAFQSTLDAEGPDAAYALVRDELRRNPTLLGLDRLLEAQLLAAPAERRHDLELVRNLVQGQTRRLARYTLRELRLSRAAVLLAMSGVPELGDLPAAADRGVRPRTVSPRARSPEPRRLRPGRLRPCTRAY